ncbi:MAG: porin family protein [Prevotellaceae bacterium]|nr:porin family protein [Prevotellaceae bacterium]
MKKIIIVAVAALMATQVSAQKGSKFISGAIGLQVNPATSYDGKSDGTSTTRFTLAPSFTYFVADKLAVGGKIGIVSTSYTEYVNGEKADPQPEGSFDFLLAPYVRYNLLEVGPLKLFAQGGIDLAFGDYTTIGVSVKPGVQYQANDRLSLDLTLVNLLEFTNVSNSDRKSSETNFNLFVNNVSAGQWYPQISFNFHF